MKITSLQAVFIAIHCLFIATTYACSCQEQTTLQSYCRAEWVSHLRVKLRMTKQPMPNNTLSKGLTVIKYVVNHTHVYKVPSKFANNTLPIEVFTPSQAAACGLVLEAGKEYLLTGRTEDETLTAALCGQIARGSPGTSTFESVLEWSMLSEKLKEWLNKSDSIQCPQTSDARLRS